MPNERASINDILDLTGYLRGIARRRKMASPERDTTLIMDEILAEIGMPSLAAQLGQLRQLATH